MGTHTIFESDFDCLTEYINMSEAVNRIRSPVDEFAAKKEDYLLDSSIKIGAGLLVGSVIGFATRRVLLPIRYPALIGAGMGAGMALERYSYQLSAPYMNPPSTPVDPTAPILTNTALPLGGLWSAIFPETKAEPVAEVVAEVAEPAVIEETSQEETVAEAVVEAVEEAASEVAEVVEEVVEAAVDVVEEVKEAVNEIAEEVKEVAEEVIEADEVVKIELVEEVEAQAQEVEHVAEEVKEVAQEI